LFELSTEVSRKRKAGKPNEFGKMVENQIVIDYKVYRVLSNPGQMRRVVGPLSV
jgi:hypothetical protein